MAANVKINVNLDASQAQQAAGQLGQQLAQASINGANIQVGNPAQTKATKDEAVQLNQTLKQLLISVQRLNIALAKSAKLMAEVNKGKGRPSQAKTDAIKQFDNMIAASEAAIKSYQQLAPAVQSVQKPAEDTAKKINDVGNKTEEAASKGRKFKGFLSETKKEMQTFETLANSFFSPITIALIAFEAVVKTFTYFWDNLTESIQKMTIRSQAAIKAIDRKQKALDKEARASQDLVKQLEDLNKQQNLSIDQQRLAESIISKLNKQYKDLGITLDETTGKYIGLYEAQRKIDQRNRQSQATSLKGQIDAQRDVVNAALANAFGRGINLDNVVKGSDFFTLAEVLGKTLGAENADILARKWNTKDLEKQLEVIDQLIQGLSTSNQVLKNGPEARQALATLIDYKKQLQELNSVDTQIIDANKRLEESFKGVKDSIQKTKDEIEQLVKSFEDQQRENSLAQLDPEDRANALRAEVAQLEKRNEVLEEAQKLGQKESDKHNADNFDDLINLEAAQDDLRRLESQKEQLNQQIAEQTQKFSNLMEKARGVDTNDQFGDVFVQNKDATQKQQDYIDQANKAAEKAKELQEQLNQTTSELNSKKEETKQLEVDYQQSQQKSLEYEQGLANLEKQRQENLNAIQAKQQQIANIEAQLEEARRKAEEAEAEKLQRQQDAIKGVFRGYEEKQSVEYLKVVGLQKQAVLLEAQLNAEKAKGAKLTEEEVESLKQYLNVDDMLSQFKNNEKLDIGRETVITNDLARKGGYASSVVVDRSVDVNQQILSVQKSQQQLMTDIKDLVKQYSVIQ